MKNQPPVFTTLLAIVCLATLGQPLKAQHDRKAQDIRAIKSMLGCYNVDFKYTETFAPEVDYEKAYDYTSAGMEWAELVEESADRIVIQHLLILHDTVVIKHWRQDWIYEADRQFTYDKDNRWVIKPLDEQQVRGKWTQKVYQVDDSPRYSGTATWSHVDGISSWYNKADSPLPRREYTKRSDYNVMKRGNRVQITSTGWLHEQDNDKVIREDGKPDVLLVQEKGYNTYERLPDEDCRVAREWWQQHHEMWADVRLVWDEILHNGKEIQLHEARDGKRLFDLLRADKQEWNPQNIAQLIDQYVISSGQL